MFLISSRAMRKANSETFYGFWFSTQTNTSPINSAPIPFHTDALKFLQTKYRTQIKDFAVFQLKLCFRIM